MFLVFWMRSYWIYKTFRALCTFCFNCSWTWNTFSLVCVYLSCYSFHSRHISHPWLTFIQNHFELFCSYCERNWFYKFLLSHVNVFQSCLLLCADFIYRNYGKLSHGSYGSHTYRTISSQTQIIWFLSCKFVSLWKFFLPNGSG